MDIPCSIFDIPLFLASRFPAVLITGPLLSLDSVLEEVASRRCAECHKESIPRKYYTRMLEPENNSFMLAPLAVSAGGTEKCGRAIFKSKADQDYRKIMDVLRPLQEMLEQRPRADMLIFDPTR